MLKLLQYWHQYHLGMITGPTGSQRTDPQSSVSSTRPVSPPVSAEEGKVLRKEAGDYLAEFTKDKARLQKAGSLLGQDMEKLTEMLDRVDQGGTLSTEDAALIKSCVAKLKGVLVGDKQAEIQGVTKRFFGLSNKPFGKLLLERNQLQGQIDKCDNSAQKAVLQAKLDRLDERLAEKTRGHLQSGNVVKFKEYWGNQQSNKTLLEVAGKDVELRRKLAGESSTSPQVLAQLAQRYGDDGLVATRLLANPKLTGAGLHALLEHNPEAVKAACDKDPKLCLAVVSLPTTPSAVLGTLAQKYAADPGIREALLQNPRTPEEAIAGIMGDKPNLQRSSAADARSSSNVLLYLATHHGDDPKVVASLLANPSTPGEALATLLTRYDDAETKLAVAKHPKATKELLQTLSTSDDLKVRAAVAHHRNTGTATLETLAGDRDATVRVGVASHFNTRDDILEKLARDEVKGVSDAAVTNLADDYPLRLDAGNAKLKQLTSDIASLVVPEDKGALPEFLTKLNKLRADLQQVQKDMTSAFTVMKDRRAGDGPLSMEANRLNREMDTKVSDQLKALLPVSERALTAHQATLLESFNALPKNLKDLSDQDEMQGLVNDIEAVRDKAELARNVVVEAMKAAGKSPEDIQTFKDRFNADVLRPMSTRRDQIQAIDDGINVNLKVTCDAIAKNHGDPNDADMRLAQVVSRIPRTSIDQINRDVQVATMLMQRLDTGSVSGGTVDSVLRTALPDLLRRAGEADDQQKFFTKDLPALLDEAITTNMAPKEKAQYLFAMVFGKDPLGDQALDPNVRADKMFQKLAREMANPDALSAKQLAGRIELLKNVKTAMDAKLMDPLTALNKAMVLPPTIDLSTAIDRGELGSGVKGVEKTFWIEMADGTKMIAKKSGEAHMTAHERIAHAFGGFMDMPVNKVQLGQFLVDGKMETVSVHQLVGTNPQSAYRVATELGFEMKDMEFRDIHWGLQRVVGIKTGPSNWNLDDGGVRYSRVKERVSNPEIFDRIGFFDRVMDNEDRHAKNYMAVDAGLNEKGEQMYEIHLIDHGRTLGWEGDLNVDAKKEAFREYLGTLSSPKNALHLENVRADMERLASMSDEQIDELFAGTDSLLTSELHREEVALFKANRDRMKEWLAGVGVLQATLRNSGLI